MLAYSFTLPILSIFTPLIRISSLFGLLSPMWLARRLVSETEDMLLGMFALFSSLAHSKPIVIICLFSPAAASDCCHYLYLQGCETLDTIKHTKACKLSMIASEHINNLLSCKLTTLSDGTSVMSSTFFLTSYFFITYPLLFFQHFSVFSVTRIY